MNSKYQLARTGFDRSSNAPLCYHLYEILRGKIIDGKWPTGTMIPPETNLCTTFQVSQIMARQAPGILVNDGLIYRQLERVASFTNKPSILACPALSALQYKCATEERFQEVGLSFQVSWRPSRGSLRSSRQSLGNSWLS